MLLIVFLFGIFTTGHFGCWYFSAAGDTGQKLNINPADDL